MLIPPVVPLRKGDKKSQTFSLSTWAAADDDDVSLSNMNSGSVERVVDRLSQDFACYGSGIPFS
jgi:hypothetical protein